MHKLSVLLLTSLFIASCAEERPYDKVHIDDKNTHVTKKEILSLCSMDDPCLMAPTVGEIPYKTTASRPFWQGEAKVVAFNITETKLEVLALETDDRYQDNQYNNVPVVSFDIKHVDYRCREDARGKCSNVEEENDEIHWSKRRFIKIDANSFDKLETNTLPTDLDKLFGSSCVSTLDQQVNSFIREKDALNINYKKTYSADGKCLTAQTWDELQEQLESASFSVEYMYSFVKLSKLADPNYNVIDYPLSDEEKFGFFKTVDKKLTVDGHGHYREAISTMMNRFSPNKSEVIYYLSKEFYRRENKGILDSTYEAIQTVNNSLREANVNFKIVLKDGSQKSVGDLRNNFIILVTDPLAGGLLGYGPSIANPFTGEILKAQTVMYPGTLKKFISRAYDELYEDFLRQQQEAAQTSENSSKMANEKNHNKTSAGKKSYLRGKISQGNILLEETNFDQLKIPNQLDLVTNPYVARRNYDIRIDDILGVGEEIDAVMAQNAFDKYKDRMEEYSRNNIYHASNVNFVSAAQTSLMKDLESKKYEGYWDQLDEKKREEIINKVMPVIYIPTLVHELGHNLGLRHNFAGSRDKDNYYNKRELQAMKIDRPISYSSVMDYSYSNLNQLPIMGKYDIAALRYGYARQVEEENGQLRMLMGSNLAELAQSTKLKTYDFCTDENVGTDPLCNRFDEGTDNVEIVQHYINAYNKRIDEIRKRGRRYDFNAYSGDLGYINYIFGSFANIRTFFDHYDQMVFQGDEEEVIKSLNDVMTGDDLDDKEKYTYGTLVIKQVQKGESLSEKEYQTLKKLNEKLKTGDDVKSSELRQVTTYLNTQRASDMSFNFLLEQLKTPSYHCAKIDFSKGQIIEVKPFKEYAQTTPQLGFNFDMAFGCEYLHYLNQQDGDKNIAYFGFGEHFNNTMDFLFTKRDDRAKSYSQIDVRGNWMNKFVSSLFMSMKMARPSIGVVSSGNYLEHPRYKTKFDEVLNGYLTNNMSGEQIIRNALTGQAFKVNVDYTFHSSHSINLSYSPVINWFAGLRQAQNDFKSIMMKVVKENVKNTDTSGKDNSLYYSMHVQKLSNWVDVEDQRFEKTVVFRGESGRIKGRFGIWKDSKVGLDLATLYEDIQLLESKSLEEIQAYIDLLKVTERNAPMPEELTALVGVSIEEIIAHANGSKPIEALKDYTLEMLQAGLELKLEARKNPTLPEALKDFAKLSSEENISKYTSGQMTTEVLYKSFLALAQ
jgi:uncharacterized protein YaiE (UPF0345 family)